MLNKYKTKKELLADIEQLQTRILQSEFHFSEVQRIAKVGSFEFYIDGRPAKWSSETYRIFERDPALQELTNEEFLELVHPDDREILNYKMDNFFLKKKKIEFEYRIILPDDSIKYISSIGQPITDGKGKVEKVIGVIIDITERKLSESNLKLSEARLAEAQKIAHLGNWEWDMINDKIIWSEEVSRIAGLENSQYGNKLESFFNRIHPHDFDLVQEKLREILNGKGIISYDFRIILPDSTIQYVHIEAELRYHNSTPVKLVGIIQDITRLKHIEIENENYRNHLESLVEKRTKDLIELNNKLEQEVVEREIIAESLKQSEERWQFAIEGSNEGIWDWNLESNRIFYSDRWQQIFEVDFSDYDGSIEDWYNLIHPDDIDVFKIRLNKHLKGDNSTFITEHRINCKNGVQKWLLVRGRVVVKKNGNPTRMVGTVNDFTERKKIDDALEWELEVNEAIANLSSFFLSKQSITIEEISDLVLDSAKKLTNSKFGFVGYIDPNTGFFNIPTFTNDIFPSYKMVDNKVVFKEFKGLWGWVLKNHKPIITNDISQEPRSTGIPEGHIGIKRFISAPALYGNELVGQLSLANSDKDYSDKDLALLVRLASFLAIIIQNKRTLDALQESERFLQSTLDALPAHIAILDSNGIIISVNKPWKNFAENNNFIGCNYGIGSNYFNICSVSTGAFSEEARDVYNGIKSVLNNEHEKYELEYPCHSITEKRWFLLSVTRFQGEGGTKLVVSHDNVTKRKEFEQKIKSQNTFLRNILRSLTYPFFVIDARDFTVKMANQAAKDLYEGMKEGSPCYSLSGSNLCSNHDQSCLIEIVKHTKKPAVRERQIKDKLGNTKIFSVHGYPIINLRGDVIQIIEYCFDITERRSAEAKLFLQSTALESADNAIVITDYEGNITWVNAAFSKLTGYSFEEIIGYQPNLLKSGMHKPGYYKELWETVKAGKVWRNEIINKKKGGELYTEEITITPVRDIYDKITHFIAIKQDISDRKRAEKEIHEALEKEKELNELRSRFVSTISHEFRTPLTSIQASAELLERYSERWSNEKKMDTLQRIKFSVEHMNEMISDVLTINKAESGKVPFNPKPVIIDQFCKEILEEIRLSANSSHKITFNNNCNKTILNLDDKLLRNILSNLLSNAVKYSPKGGNVEFEIKLEEDTFSIVVIDEGIGIPVEDQNKLFEPFFRGNNIENISGTGLGLSILKRAVDIHKGVIFFESEQGKGTTFYIKLPLNN